MSHLVYDSSDDDENDNTKYFNRFNAEKMSNVVDKKNVKKNELLKTCRHCYTNMSVNNRQMERSVAVSILLVHL